MAIRRGIEFNCTTACLFKPECSELLCKTNHAKAGAETLLRMLLSFHDKGHQLGRPWARFLGPGDDPLWSPLHHSPMA